MRDSNLKVRKAFDLFKMSFSKLEKSIEASRKEVSAVSVLYQPCEEDNGRDETGSNKIGVNSAIQ